MRRLITVRDRREGWEPVGHATVLKALPILRTVRARLATEDYLRYWADLARTLTESRLLRTLPGQECVPTNHARATPRVTTRAGAIRSGDVHRPHRYDGRNTTHYVLMSITGGMGRSERQVVQRRVRLGMAAQVEQQGRYQGGRPPFGYTTEPVGPHPNQRKAAEGY